MKITLKLTGELTPKGFEVKKKRLMDDMYKAAVKKPCATGNDSAIQLKEAANHPKLSESINRLFNINSRQPNPSRIKEITRATKRNRENGDKSSGSLPMKKSRTSAAENIVVEVVCMPKYSVTIPRGQYKQKLQDAGHFNHMAYKTSDSCDDIQNKIVSVFPKVLAADATFSFLDARSKHLEKIFDPPNGALEWNGEAIAALSGHGRLYILPSTAGTSVDNAKSISTPLMAQSTSGNADTGVLINLVDCSCTSISAVNANPAVTPCEGKQDKPAAKDVLPPAILSLLNDRLVGQAILEYADLQPSSFPEDKV